MVLLLVCIVGSLTNRMHMEPLTTCELADYPETYTKKYDFMGNTVVRGNTAVRGNIFIHGNTSIHGNTAVLL